MQYRIIYSLYLEFEPLPTDPPGQITGVVVPLNRDGNSTVMRVRPMPPKFRAVDLRPGDEVRAHGPRRTVKSISAYRDNWVSEEGLASLSGAGGYVYRPAS